MKKFDIMQYLVRNYPQIEWVKDGDKRYRGLLGEFYIAFEYDKWDGWVTKSQIKGMVEVLEEKAKA